MAINTALFANPQIGAAYQKDPRLGYAQALLQNGSSTAPVLSPGEAFARALQAPLGGFLASNLRGGYQAQDQQYRAGLAAALKGDDPVTALSNSADPTLQQMGLEQQLSLGQARAKAKIDLGNTLAAKGLQIGADGSVQPMAGFGAAQGNIANQSTMAQIPGKVAEGQAMIPVNAQGAAANAAAVSPITTQTAANTARATLPIDVQKATAIAQNVAPIEVAKEIEKYNSTTGKQNLITNTGQLADDYRNDVNIKNYQTVAPIYESMKQAAKVNNRAADLNMVYGMAKIFDPNSVVREGEQVLVTNTQSLPSELVGYINKLNGGQSLQPEARQQLLGQAGSRVGQLQSIYDAAQTFYSNRATQLGKKPSDVFYNVPQQPQVIQYDSQGNPAQ